MANQGTYMGTILTRGDQPDTGLKQQNPCFRIGLC
ncbi:MAG: hypothetical protein JWP94_352 [Mucilaginibacter sp.]|jgi:hypothetical protein|nr:hypothetical protein [Mucilaginibacter sp.]